MVAAPKVSGRCTARPKGRIALHPSCLDPHLLWVKDSILVSGSGTLACRLQDLLRPHDGALREANPARLQQSTTMCPCHHLRRRLCLRRCLRQRRSLSACSCVCLPCTPLSLCLSVPLCLCPSGPEAGVDLFLLFLSPVCVCVCADVLAEMKSNMRLQMRPEDHQKSVGAVSALHEFWQDRPATFDMTLQYQAS